MESNKDFVNSNNKLIYEKSLNSNTIIFNSIYKNKNVKIKRFDLNKGKFNPEKIKNNCEFMKKMYNNINYSVKIIDNFKKDEYYYIVYENCDTNLEDVIRKSKSGISVRRMKGLMNQFNEVMKYIVENKKAHRNIKPSNILLNKKNTLTGYKIIVSDYSYDKPNEKDENNYIYNYYIPPEVLNNNEGDFSKEDLWSIGIMLFRMYIKQYPFNFQEYSDFMSSKGKIKFKSLNKIKNKELKDLVTRLLSYEPNKRIKWEDYFNHPFFKIDQNTLNNEIIFNKKVPNEININEKPNFEMSGIIPGTINIEVPDVNLHKNLKSSKPGFNYNNEGIIEGKANIPDIDFNPNLDVNLDVKKPNIKGDINVPNVNINDGENISGVIKGKKNINVPGVEIKGSKIKGDLNLPTGSKINIPNVNVNVPDINLNENYKPVNLRDLLSQDVDADYNLNFDGRYLGVPSINGESISGYINGNLKQNIKLDIPEIKGKEINVPDVNLHKNLKSKPGFNYNNEGIIEGKANIPDIDFNPNLDVNLDVKKPSIKGDINVPNVNINDGENINGVKKNVNLNDYENSIPNESKNSLRFSNNSIIEKQKFDKKSGEFLMTGTIPGKNSNLNSNETFKIENNISNNDSNKNLNINSNLYKSEIKYIKPKIIIDNSYSNEYFNKSSLKNKKGDIEERIGNTYYAPNVGGGINFDVNNNNKNDENIYSENFKSKKSKQEFSKNNNLLTFKEIITQNPNEKVYEVKNFEFFDEINKEKLKKFLKNK